LHQPRGPRISARVPAHRRPELRARAAKDPDPASPRRRRRAARRHPGRSSSRSSIRLVLVGGFDRHAAKPTVLPAATSQAQVLEVVIRRHEASGHRLLLAGGATPVTSHARLMKKAAVMPPLPRGIEAPMGARETGALRHRSSVGVIRSDDAFGRGIDRSDVRYVVHAAGQRAFEAVQQETGTRGLDGLPAECVSSIRPAETTPGRSRGRNARAKTIRADASVDVTRKSNRMGDMLRFATARLSPPPIGRALLREAGARTRIGAGLRVCLGESRNRRRFAHVLAEDCPA